MNLLDLPEAVQKWISIPAIIGFVQELLSAGNDGARVIAANKLAMETARHKTDVDLAEKHRSDR